MISNHYSFEIDLLLIFSIHSFYPTPVLLSITRSDPIPIPIQFPPKMKYNYLYRRIEPVDISIDIFFMFSIIFQDISKTSRNTINPNPLTTQTRCYWDTIRSKDAPQIDCHYEYIRQSNNRLRHRPYHND